MLFRSKSYYLIPRPIWYFFDRLHQYLREIEYLVIYYDLDFRVSSYLLSLTTITLSEAAVGGISIDVATH
jgi:hypothetical protein